MNIDKDNRKTWNFKKKVIGDDKFAKFVEEYFSERERNLIANCITYADNKPAGLPGHNLMVIIEKLFLIAEYGYNSLDDEARRKLDAFHENQVKHREGK